MHLCLSQFQLSTFPRQPPGISSKKPARGVGTSTRAGILWKMKSKLQKYSLDQIFTGENKKKATKKQVKFLTFFEVYVFFQKNLPGLWVNFLVLLSHIPCRKSEELPLACLFEVFTGSWLSTSTFCIKSYDYVKHFVRVLVLLVINTGCLKKISKKWVTLRC